MSDLRYVVVVQGVCEVMINGMQQLTHGSFTSILSTLGQQALELQLERFFTPWAWSWDLEDGHEFSEHLGTHILGCCTTPSYYLQGIPLHPSFQTLVTILDKFSLGLPNHSSSIIISPPHVVPCSKYSAANYSPSLPPHLLSLVPRIPELSYDTHSDHTSDRTVKLKPASQGDSSNGKDPPKAHISSQSTFLGIPSTNGGMDMRKWNWPGYFSFGRGSSKRPTLESKRIPLPDEKPDASEPATAVEVDKHALEDAISENISIAAANTPKEVAVEPEDAPHLSAQSNGIDLPKDSQNEDMEPLPAVGDAQANHIPAEADTVSLALSTSSSVVSPEPSPMEMPGPEFSFTNVYLADPENPLVTRRRRIYYTLVSVSPLVHFRYP
jgi:hypothetical protein